MNKRLFIIAIALIGINLTVSNADAVSPVASLTPTPSATVYVGETVTFNAGASEDPDGSIEEYEWTLPSQAYCISGQGTSILKCKFTPASTSDYVVSIKVKDNDGYWSTSEDCDVTVYSANLDWYVATSGDDDNDGQSWETAFRNIQIAIDSTIDGDVVNVAEGNYYENISIKGKAITVTGIDPNDPATINSTVINGDGFRPVVSFDGSEGVDSILAGLTITTSLDPNLVAYWKLDESDGDPNNPATVDSAGSNDGTIQGNPGWPNGVDANSIELDGVDDYVTIGDIDFADQMSGGLWVKPNEVLQKPLFGQAFTTPKREFYLQQRTDSFKIRVDTDSDAQAVQSVTVPAVGVWYHVFWTYDGSYLRLYINGVKEGETALTGNVFDTDDSYGIGALENGTGMINATIDDVRIYDRGLSSYEVEELYKGPGGGLAAHWKFNDNAQDSFGVNDGTTYGTPDWAEGIDGNSIELDGINDYVEISDAPSLRPTNHGCSVGFWMQSEIDSQDAMIISKRLNAPVYEQYSIGLSQGNSYGWGVGKKITFLFRENSSKEKGGYTTADVDFSQWTQVFVVLDELTETVRVYINGSEVSVTLDHDGDFPNIDNTDDLTIGGNSDVLDLFNGTLDDVYIYDRALNSPEVGQLYSKQGGGISGNRTSATIKQCVVKGNKSEYGGGIAGVDGLIDRCIVMNNSAIDGGGIADCNGLIMNSIIADNDADYFGGGLVDCFNTITNCTIADNTALSGAGLSYCDALITNCIIWGNDPNQLGDSSEPSYSCIQGIPAGHETNINSDPLFLDPYDTNNPFMSYHIAWNSPCIDKGDPDEGSYIGLFPRCTTRHFHQGHQKHFPQ